MATLEVHDGQGRVQFVEIARDHPILFGTSASCDVLLEGEGIRPVHGRIRWNRKRYKLEASPDAEFVLINGHKMTTSSLQQGDEITVGACRIYLIRVDDDLNEASRSNALPDDYRTRVRAPSDAPRPDSHRRGRGSRTSASARDEPPMLERDDWLDALRTKPRGRDASDTAPVPLSRKRKRSPKGERSPGRKRSRVGANGSSA
jgi:hypothetical protein